MRRIDRSGRSVGDRSSFVVAHFVTDDAADSGTPDRAEHGLLYRLRGVESIHRLSCFGGSSDGATAGRAGPIPGFSGCVPPWDSDFRHPAEIARSAGFVGFKLRGVPVAVCLLAHIAHCPAAPPYRARTAVASPRFGMGLESV